MTAIVGMALGKRPIPKETEQEFATANFLLPGGQVRTYELHIFFGLECRAPNSRTYYTLRVYLSR